MTAFTVTSCTNNKSRTHSRHAVSSTMDVKVVVVSNSSTSTTTPIPTAAATGTASSLLPPPAPTCGALSRPIHHSKTADNHTNNTDQNVHCSQLSATGWIFSYTSGHPTHTNQPYPALRNPEIVNMADFGGLVRTTIIIQVQNMAFERNPSFESDLADVLEALFSLPATDSYTGESTGAPATIQVMRVSLPEEDKSLMDMLVGKWSVEVLSQEQAFVRVSVRPPLGLGRRAKKFFANGCGMSTKGECPAIAPLIMMDRHQFYIPFNNSMCHAAVRQYSEEIRKAAQASRHLYTDRLPSRPLKIKFEACKDGMDFLQEFPQR